MYFQDPSLLQFQKRLEKRRHKNNLQTLFDVKKIPESAQLRTVIDAVDSEHFRGFFNGYFRQLQRLKHLEVYQLFPGLYLAAIDGTDYFSSTTISCEHCLTQKKEKSSSKSDEQGEINEEETMVRYSHKALQVAIMHPDKSELPARLRDQ